MLEDLESINLKLKIHGYLCNEINDSRLLQFVSLQWCSRSDIWNFNQVLSLKWWQNKNLKKKKSNTDTNLTESDTWWWGRILIMLTSYTWRFCTVRSAWAQRTCSNYVPCFKLYFVWSTTNCETSKQIDRYLNGYRWFMFEVLIFVKIFCNASKC